jgi:hypothetical protein
MGMTKIKVIIASFDASYIFIVIQISLMDDWILCDLIICKIENISCRFISLIIVLAEHWYLS